MKERECWREIGREEEGERERRGKGKNDGQRVMRHQVPNKVKMFSE